MPSPQKHALSLSLAAVAVSITLCPLDLHCQATTSQHHERKAPADAAELASIAQRGRAIAAYDTAAWRATDAVQALHPKTGSVCMYVGRNVQTGWDMAFGCLNEAKDAFLLAYDVKPAKDVAHPEVIVNALPSEERGDWLPIARAIDIARTKFGSQNRPYNDAVLPAEKGGWYVYFYPAATTKDSFPTGADVRYRVSPDGLNIEDTHLMHASVIDFKKPADGSKTTHTLRATLIDDVPEDTDVANVLMMGGIPALILSKNFVYQISPDGTPTYLMTSEAFMKTVKNK